VKPQTRRETRQLVILTGLSGSGKSTVLHAFEDMGFYCVDNLPVNLIPIFAELHAAGEGDFARAALLVDAREGMQLEKLPPLLKHLKKDHPISCGGTARPGARIPWERIFPYGKVCRTNAR
jgi:UPF0042 nucleotide-binding protein